MFTDTLKTCFNNCGNDGGIIIIIIIIQWRGHCDRQWGNYWTAINKMGQLNTTVYTLEYNFMFVVNRASLFPW
jgi:hypothetical protein